MDFVITATTNHKSPPGFLLFLEPGKVLKIPKISYLSRNLLRTSYKGLARDTQGQNRKI